MGRIKLCRTGTAVTRRRQSRTVGRSSTGAYSHSTPLFHFESGRGGEGDTTVQFAMTRGGIDGDRQTPQGPSHPALLLAITIVPAGTVET